MVHSIEDQASRQRALHPGTSFIVQAPAGSGKTELLTRRFLALLATVDNPEEILAITFTRKAAAEMRLRIIESLESFSKLESTPESDFEKQGYDLAKAAYQRNIDCDWNLLAQPNRLRVQTIDSFCSSLVRQMPVLSHSGALPDVGEQAETLYNQAVAEMLRDVLSDETDSELSIALEKVLVFLDNKVPRLQSMLVSLLGKRDQWLRHINGNLAGDELRSVFEEVIQAQVTKHLSQLCIAAPMALEPDLFRLCRYAQSNLRLLKPEAMSEHLLDREHFPEDSWIDLLVWRDLSEVVLTASGTVRVSLTKNNGFPSGAKGEAELYGFTKPEMQANKKAFIELLSQLAENDAFISALGTTRELPTGGYSDEQWALLGELPVVLNSVIGYLTILFHENNTVDYVEISKRATLALGEDDNPTDLGLSLEYRLKHLLVDEFQDTSLSQFTLFKKITAGWQAGDGHTFFAVGDPMQSIYRFREADVSLFLQASTVGIGDVKLEPLTLTVNFRSRKPIIDWVNNCFTQIFPKQNNRHLGAVSYSPSISFKGESDESFVKCLFLRDGSKQQEATRIAEICAERLSLRPDETIAILLRAKKQSQEIVEALREKNIAYSAVEMEFLSERAVIRDLMSLLQAILHPADRISWLAVLRAPWCGLTLCDMDLLSNCEKSNTIWEAINNQKTIRELSDDGRSRLQRLREGLEPAMQARLRGVLAGWLEAAWKSIGGDNCIESTIDFHAVDMFFELAREAEANGRLLNESKLRDDMLRLFAPPSSDPNVRVQLMSIHKSKGLEFATVILPGLNRKGANDSSELLNWVEFAGDGDASDLLLAPVNSTGNAEPILNLVKNVSKLKAENELLRVLYVGTTRARERLYLTACPNIKKDGSPQLAPGSMLKALEPVVRADLLRLDEPREADADDFTDEIDTQVQQAPPLKRLKADWQPPKSNNDVFTKAQRIIDPDVESQSLEYLWVGDTARRIGSVIHRQLQRIADEGIDSWSDDKIMENKTLYIKQLTNLNVATNELSTALASVLKVLQSAISDELGRWILDSTHEDSRSEYALTANLNDKVQNIVIDRTFIDEQGVRWIIDYKTGQHSGGGLDNFFDNEVERYQEQLENYAEVLSVMEARPIKLGLYFPLYQSFRQWGA